MKKEYAQRAAKKPYLLNTYSVTEKKKEMLYYAYIISLS